MSEERARASVVVALALKLERRLPGAYSSRFARILP